MMTGMTGRVRAWAGGAVVAAAVVGLGAYFAVSGLNKASELAGVASAFIGLAALAVSVYAVRQAHRDASPPTTAGGQSVTRSRVMGWIRQVSGVKGNVRIGAPSPSVATPAPVAEGFKASSKQPAAGGPELAGEATGPVGAQSVTDSEVGGGITQINGVDGDVDISQ